jgi:hypothetical protein
MIIIDELTIDTVRVCGILVRRPPGVSRIDWEIYWQHAMSDADAMVRVMEMGDMEW